MNRTLVASILLFAVGLSFSMAYAYTEPIDLPRGDYLANYCRISIYAFPQWIYTCDYIYEEKLNFTNEPMIPDAITIPPITGSPDPVGSMMVQLQDFIDALKSNDPNYNPPETPGELDGEELTPDQEAKLAECFRGYDRYASWGAFVDTSSIDGYQDKVREQFPDRDNLNQVPSILAAIKAIEECDAIEDYVFFGNIGAREHNMAVADRNDIGQRGEVAQLTRGNEPSKGFADDNTATKEELKSEADRAFDFSCSPENQARKLCYPYQAFTGVNRGTSAPIVERGGAYFEAQSYLGTPGANALEVAQITLCEITWHNTGNGGSSLSTWPDILTNGFCDDKLSFQFLRENGKFSSLETAREQKGLE